MNSSLSVLILLPAAVQSHLHCSPTENLLRMYFKSQAASLAVPVLWAPQNNKPLSFALQDLCLLHYTICLLSLACQRDCYTSAHKLPGLVSSGGITNKCSVVVQQVAVVTRYMKVIISAFIGCFFKAENGDSSL